MSGWRRGTHSGRADVRGARKSRWCCFRFPAAQSRGNLGQKPGVNSVEAAVGHDHHLVARLKAGGNLFDDLAGRGKQWASRPCFLRSRTNRSRSSRRWGPASLERRSSTILRGRHRRNNGKIGSERPVGGPLRTGVRNRPHAVLGKLPPDGGQGGGNGGGMVGEIVEDGDSGGLAADLQASLHALEGAQSHGNGVPRQAQSMSAGQGRQRIPDVEDSGEWNLEPAPSLPS